VKTAVAHIVALALLGVARAGVSLDVPFVEQSQSACGPASAAMVVQYWAREMPERTTLAAEAESIARTSVPPKGISGSELRRLLENRGFTVFVLNAEMRDLTGNLDKGRPLIVCFAPRGKSGPLHYAVVAGLEEDTILLNDPTRGKLFRERLTRFLPQWKATGNWALLAVPRMDR
jgi:ABC-type bacteriocin/lantibiotic exporter with double-glycine peptidase domain